MLEIGYMYYFIHLDYTHTNRGSREDMAAMASPGVMSPGQGPPSSDQRSTLMEDPDVWRPT